MTDQKYKLVPVELTPEMHSEMLEMYGSNPDMPDYEIEAPWSAAIPAAPKLNRGDWTQYVLKRLRRFEECCEDGDNDGCDIGREWLDALTTIGALKRVRRSPARWEITPLGESMLAAAPEPVCRWTPAKQSLAQRKTGWFWPGCTDGTAIRIECINSGSLGYMIKPTACPHCGKKVEVVEDE